MVNAGSLSLFCLPRKKAERRINKQGKGKKTKKPSQQTRKGKDPEAP
jgi:hypothetical protein